MCDELAEALTPVGNTSKKQRTNRLALLTCGLLVLLLSVSTFAQAQPPDLVILNANIRTLVTEKSGAQALSVTGDRISAVGSDRSIRKLIGPSTRVIDAKGRLIIPGFNDSHVHFMGIGNIFSTLDLRSAKTPSEITDRISFYLRFVPKGRWIVGHGWNEAKPAADAINRISPDNPVLLHHADGRTAFANAAALTKANVKAPRVDEGGIVRDAVARTVSLSVPENHARDWPAAAEAATNYAASLGVTSVQDMHSDDSRDIYRELDRQGKLKTRIYDCISLPDWRKLLVPDPGRSNMVRSGCLKGISDGDENYTTKLLKEVAAADKAGLQVMVHAVGNAPNDIVLGVFEQVIRTNGRRDRRFRVEHAHNPRQVDLPRFLRSNIIASMQPHLFAGGSGGYYSSLLKGKIAFGSDAAITDMNPLLGIHAAANAEAESISVYEAVRAYTVGSAYAEFQEKEKGTIELDKLADFIILSDDIFAAPKAVRDARVVLTVVSGKVVYEK